MLIANVQISAIWLVKKSTILAALYLGFNIVLFDEKTQQQHSNAVAGKNRNLLVQNKLMINY